MTSTYVFSTRCAHYSEGFSDPVILFLHFYSRYMAGEKKVVEDESDRSGKKAKTYYLITITCNLLYLFLRRCEDGSFKVAAS